MNKRCLVIGGSGYVGSAVCERLRAEDCQVVSTYHTRPHPDGLACDLRDFDSLEQVVATAVERLGGLDAVIGAAGVSGDDYFYQKVSAADYDRLQPIDRQAFDQVLETNARGNFALCRAAAPYLEGGNLVLISAIDGIKPVPAASHFAASQAALKGMVESLAKELGHRQTCINLVALGILEGGLSSKLGEELRQAYLTHCSLKRLGKAAEVAEMVAWLVVENTYLTGQTLLLDGGL